MRLHRWLVLILLPVLIGRGMPVRAADFASSLFRIQWLQGEGDVPNFWGPSATEGIMEPYAESPGGSRLVQYFDKGRMELTDPASGVVTNGLLAKELITGDQQTGNAATTHHDPPAIPVAGDPGGVGPTYAMLNTTGAPLFAPTPNRGNMELTASFSDDGRLVVQVFEQRVLTYTESNPDPFKIEFGNIGRHYYAWRHPEGG